MLLYDCTIILMWLKDNKGSFVFDTEVYEMLFFVCNKIIHTWNIWVIHPGYCSNHCVLQTNKEESSFSSLIKMICPDLTWLWTSIILYLWADNRGSHALSARLKMRKWPMVQYLNANIHFRKLCSKSQWVLHNNVTTLLWMIQTQTRLLKVPTQQGECAVWLLWTWITIKRNMVSWQMINWPD